MLATSTGRNWRSGNSKIWRARKSRPRLTSRPSPACGLKPGRSWPRSVPRPSARPPVFPVCHRLTSASFWSVLNAGAQTAAWKALTRMVAAVAKWIWRINRKFERAGRAWNEILTPSWLLAIIRLPIDNALLLGGEPEGCTDFLDQFRVHQVRIGKITVFEPTIPEIHARQLRTPE